MMSNYPQEWVTATPGANLSLTAEPAANPQTSESSNDLRLLENTKYSTLFQPRYAFDLKMYFFVFLAIGLQLL